MVTDKKEDSKNWLEHLVTGIAGLLVLFTFGFLIYQLIYQETTPPNIEINLGEVAQKDQGYSVPVVVKNLGTQTAENLIVEIVADVNGENEKGELNFQYVPGKSSVRGWVNFKNQPSPSSLKGHVRGYSTP